MPFDSSPPLFARGAALATILIGLLALLGSALGIAWMQGLLPGVAGMQASSAVGLVMAGTALFIVGGRPSASWRAVSVVLALLVAAFGLFTWIQQLFDAQLDIEKLLLPAGGNSGSLVAGQMSFYSALAFTAIGLALVAMPWVALQPLVWLMSALAVVIGMVSLLGYLWSTDLLDAGGVMAPVSVHAALAFTLLGIGTWRASQIRHPVGSPPVLSRTSIEIKVTSGFALAILLLLVGGGVTYRASVESARSAQWVAATQEVRALLTRLYADIVDAESAARAHVLRGSPKHRDTFFRAAAAARRTVAVLNGRIAVDLSEQAAIERLEGLAEQRLLRLEEAIEVFKNEGTAGVFALAATQEGTRDMDSLRALMNEVDDSAALRLLQAESRARVDRQKALFMLNLSLVCAVGIFLFLLSLIHI